MPLKIQEAFIRNRWLSTLLDRFLIASVASVLVIRFYLAITGYPQVGGGGLHISHMLWGGLGMLIALILSLSFPGKRTQAIVALLGGIGFGAFIDELGKFITSDNNYFFQPALPLIYIIFMLLLLSFHILESLPVISERIEPLPMTSDSASDQPREKLQAARNSLSQSNFFITIFFIGYALLLLATGSVNLIANKGTSTIVEIGWLASSFVSYVMILIGILSLRSSRLVASSWFCGAILVSIVVTQSFLLYIQPLSAIEALLVNLIALTALKTRS